ncbi:MAG: class I SAM-dependent methyltransferase [Chloroflexaceae bacterium]|nr:class I SAM-dependent methyltransferase [Chloroflexaceae bacterium]
MTCFDVFAQYYDADTQDYHDDIVLYREMARRTGDPILELMCGTGRLLLPLAEDGWHITGVDISPTMLSQAQQKIARANLDTDQVQLIEGDVRRVELPEHHFALAFVGFNSFMHLETIDDQLACLATLRRALQPDGFVLIDLPNPDPRQLLEEDNRLVLECSYELDGNQVMKTVARVSDLATQMTRITYWYDVCSPQGVISRQMMHFNARWFYRYEMEHLFARAGFVVQSCYGDYDLNEYRTESESMIFLASGQ